MNNEPQSDKIPNQKIGYIELHDARLEHVTIIKGGEGIIQFEHIAVYKQVAQDHFHVWSYRAELKINRIRDFKLDGILSGDDYVSDGQIIDPGGIELELMSLLSNSPVDRIQFDMASGAKILILADGATLDLIAPIEKFEEWKGPL